MRGRAQPNGSTRWSPNGYHYTRVRGKWVLTHRLVAEKEILGRKLRSNERVKFIDNNRKNYADPKNLAVHEVRGKTDASKRAILRAKIEDLQAQLEELED